MITMGSHSYCPREDIDCYEGVDLVIGKYCSIGSGLKIYSGNHPPIAHPEVVSTYPFREQFSWDYPGGNNYGKVTVGHDVWVSTDVKIVCGVTISTGAIVACNAVVSKDVPPYAFVAGNPGRIKRFRFSPEQIQQLLNIKWWDWPDNKVKESMPYMKDITEFLKMYAT